MAASWEIDEFAADSAMFLLVLTLMATYFNLHFNFIHHNSITFIKNIYRLLQILNWIRQVNR